MFDVLPATVGHFVCKIADTQHVYDFSALNRGPNPVHVIFSFVSTYPDMQECNLQPFARIHKSWTVLVCNVVLGLNVEFRSMSSVDGDHMHTHTFILSTETKCEKSRTNQIAFQLDRASSRFYCLNPHHMPNVCI